MELGVIDKPILVFGGPYSNLQALQALQTVAVESGIPPERILCTGDIVAYCGQPCEVVDAIREWGIHVLMGNCEESFATQADDCGCGFSEGSSCDLLSAQWFQFAKQALKPEHQHWFAQLPRTIRFTLAGKRVQLVHGSAQRINEFMFASTEEARFSLQFEHSDADMIIAGHSGIPFTKYLSDKLWLNAGAIGMPANDGQRQTWYSIVSPDRTQHSLRIAILPLEYDAKSAHETMLNAGLDNGYADALLNGLWPSMDVLPDVEKQQQGLPLQASVSQWAY